MAHLSTPPGFGTNSWFEDTWARANGVVNPRFVVADSGSWRPSVNISQPRTMDIAVGRGWACGVYDETDAVESVSFDANLTSQERWDAIVARFDWASNSVAFAVIKGTTAFPAINSSDVLNPTGVNRIPGTRYDGVLAAVRIAPGVGTFSTGGTFTDLRLWGGQSGPLNTFAHSDAYFRLMDLPNGSWLLSGDPSSDPVLFRRKGSAWEALSLGGGSGGSIPFVKVTGATSTTLQPIPSQGSVGTRLLLSRAEKADNSLFTVSSSGVLTCVRPGWYDLSGMSLLQTSSTIDRGDQRFLTIRRNGAELNVGRGSLIPVTGKNHSQVLSASSGPIQFSAGNTLDMVFLQDSGFTQNARLYQSHLTAKFLST